MNLTVPAEETVPLPPLSESLQATYDARDLRLRRFGSSQDDLALDFSRPAGPHLITEILACCTERPDGQALDPQLFWDLAVGKRIECLLILASLEEEGQFSLPLRCPNPSCSERMEVDLSIEELLEAGQEREEEERFFVQHGGERLALRRPTGADQLEWLRQPYPDKGAAVRAMVRTLTVEGVQVDLTQEWIDRIEEALDRQDPLLQLSLSVACPHCGELRPHDLAPAEFAVRVLKEAQARLIEAVHLLATRYHWSEAEIFSIPLWRRSQYLLLIERDEAR